ncbi:scavenger receptor cysteine-rich type 1 protein M130-like protein, partial [Lates japonicus]
MDHLLLLLLLLWSSGLGAEGNHDSTGSQCKPTVKADIMLLVDDSWTVNDTDFKTICSFITDTVSVFNIGPDRVQIGLSQYNGDSKADWDLNTHQTRESLLRAIANLPHKGGESMPEWVLDHNLQYNFKPHVGMRADSQKIAILITGEEFLGNMYLPLQNLKDAGIEVYAIGVKDADETELRFVASDPKDIHMFYVKEFSFLKDIVNNVTINLCNSANSL